MICINCGTDAEYIYKGNSLCCHCYELARLKEINITSEFPKELLKKTELRIQECKYWIKVGRLANDYNYPEII